MNIHLQDFRKLLKREDECNHLADYSFFKNANRGSCPLPYKLEERIELVDIVKEEKKEYIVIMENKKVLEEKIN